MIIFGSVGKLSNSYSNDCTSWKSELLFSRSLKKEQAKLLSFILRELS